MCLLDAHCYPIYGMQSMPVTVYSRVALVSATSKLASVCFLLVLQKCIVAEQMGRRGVATPFLYFQPHSRETTDLIWVIPPLKTLKAVAAMAGGEGLIRPLTIWRPKPMVPIAGFQRWLAIQPV